MPFPNFHAARVKNPGLFKTGKEDWGQQKLPNGVVRIAGRLKSSNEWETQTYRFPKDKFTAAQAQAWLKENKIKPILFEPAEEKTEQSEQEEFSELPEGIDFAEKELFNIDDKEICRVGKWRDNKGEIVNITAKMLKESVKAFDEGVGAAADGVPLRIGDHKKIYDMAGGWVKSLKKVGNSLFASFKDIPKLIKELIDKKAYKNLSSGFLNDYVDLNTKKVYPFVLNHIALLGAKIPAVKELKDWGSFYSENVEVIEFTDEGDELIQEGVSSEFDDEIPDNIQNKTLKEIKTLLDKLSKKRSDLYNKMDEQSRLARSSINVDVEEVNAQIDILRKAVGQKAVSALSEEDKKIIKEVDEMDLEKMQKDFDAKLKIEMDRNIQLTTDLNKIKTEKQESDNKTSKLVTDQKKSEINLFVETMKGEGKVLPKHEGLVKVLMENSDDSKTIEFSAEGKTETLPMRKMIENFISSLPKLVDLAAVSQDGKPKVNEFEGFEAKEVEVGGSINGQKVDFLTKKHQEKNKDMTYDVAYNVIIGIHPELTKPDKE